MPVSLRKTNHDSTSLMEEKTQWESLKAGNISALEVLYNHHADELYSYGMVLCHESGQVKDCIHDLFVYLWNVRDRLTIPDSSKAYLMVSLRRRLFDKGPKINSMTIELDGLGDLSLQTAGQEEKWIEQEEESTRHLQLEKALGRLSDRQREIIYMKYYRQMDYDEIGTIMDLNYQSARNLVTRALTALRKEMTIGIIILTLMT